ncbi:MAG TPA: hypothetical protein VJ841_05455 [Candidatus Saccharimonadales bacterium]|nr:hypothetical protein [Candidatus Saccharimonadales bacterium]
MPNSSAPNVPDGYVTEEDLIAFAATQGLSAPFATRLFNRLLRTVMHDLKQRHGIELDVRYIASPETRWPRDASEATNEVFGRAGLMIGIATLRDAAYYLRPNYSWQYGKGLDDLLKAWVRSFR